MPMLRILSAAINTGHAICAVALPGLMGNRRLSEALETMTEPSLGRHARQQTAVVFGYDKPQYQSSTAAMSALIGTSNNQAFNLEENINKGCHVVFGEPGKRRDFVTSSKLADPTGEMHKYHSRVTVAEKEVLTRTSCYMGHEITPYVTSTAQATQWDPAAVKETVALRNEIRARTGPRPTRGISYDDEVEYISEAKSQFENKFKTHKPSIMAESVKNGALLTRVLWSLGPILTSSLAPMS